VPEHPEALVPRGGDGSTIGVDLEVTLFCGRCGEECVGRTLPEAQAIFRDHFLDQHAKDAA
jgi:hypothetical protein